MSGTLYWILQLVIGAGIGIAAKSITPGDESTSNPTVDMIINVVLGIMGMGVGSWIWGMLGIGGTGSWVVNLLISIAVGLIGALLLLWIFNKFIKPMMNKA